IEVIYIYIVDSKDRLLGVVSIKEILTAPPTVPVKDIMETEVISLKSNATKSEAIDYFQRYDLLMLPVVDEEGELIGVIYVDDILDAITEKTTEDFFKMAGAQEEELFYTSHILKIAKLRLPWLLVVVFGEIVSAFIISAFELTVKQFLPVIFFLPLITAVSGMISSQSAIITARGLATGKITEYFKDFIQFLLRELKVSVVVAGVISFIVGVISYVWIETHIIGVVIAIAIFLNVIIATLLGGILPYISLKLKRDPTVATGPITLTLNDIIGVLIYLTTATLFLEYLTAK
ncbi:MAG: magnesium transporter, partial [Aquificae bacterium]|nr:magnesium transporter [Aquificota bacterium]